MLTKSILLISILLLWNNIFSQSSRKLIDEWSICKKEIYLLRSNSKNPIFDLDISTGIDSIQSKLIAVYGLDYLENNSSVQLRIPQKIGDYGFLLNVNLVHGLGKFELDSIARCFLLRSTQLRIKVNSSENVMINWEIVQEDSVYSKVKQYFTKVGIYEEYPKSFNETKLYIDFLEGTSQNTLNNLIETVLSAYLNFVEQNSDKSLCKKSKKELNELRMKYPLNIFLRLPFENSQFEEIEIIDD